MQAAAANLGKEGVCQDCGRSFLMWPAGAVNQAGATWFLQAGGSEMGPFSPEDLRKFVALGRIQPDTPIRKGTDGTWIMARQVRGLLDAPAPPTPPAPPQAAPASTARHRAAAPPPARHGRQGGLAAQLARQPGMVLAMGLGLVVIVVLVVVLSNRAGPEEDTATTPVAKAPKKDKPAPKSADTTKAKPAKKPKPRVLTTEQLVERTSPSVALILGHHSSGTGFLVAQNLIATNRHVIEAELINDVRVRFPDAEKRLRGQYGVKLRYEDPELDLAFLEVTIELPALPLARMHEFHRGEDIIAIGNPGVDGQILQNAISRGILSTETTFDGVKYYQLDVAINPGNSGGPVFNKYGHVIGVITLKASQQDGLGFCLPLATLKNSLARAQKASADESNQMRAYHRLRVTAIATMESAHLYAFAGNLYVIAMEAALAAGKDVNVGLKIARLRARSFLRRQDSRTRIAMESEAPKIVVDDGLLSDSRALFDELWTTYQALKSHIETPRGQFKAYKSKVKKMTEDLDRLARRFKSEEDMDVRLEGYRDR